jgi:hypothetical protein
VSFSTGRSYSPTETAAIRHSVVRNCTGRVSLLSHITHTDFTWLKSDESLDAIFFYLTTKVELNPNVIVALEHSDPEIRLSTADKAELEVTILRRNNTKDPICQFVWFCRLQRERRQCMTVPAVKAHPFLLFECGFYVTHPRDRP